jgi:hypothetical protein
MLFVPAHFAVLATARPVATTASYQHQQKDKPQKQPAKLYNIMQGFIIIKAMRLFIFFVVIALLIICIMCK